MNDSPLHTGEATALGATALADLYERDETEWLERMAELIRTKRLEQLDLEHLAEFLEDMAKRDKREVKSRLIILMIHCLKWFRQPSRRTRSWESTILEQRRELDSMLDSQNLKRFADEEFASLYQKARREAAHHMRVGVDKLPIACPFSLEELLNRELIEDEAAMDDHDGEPAKQQQ